MTTGAADSTTRRSGRRRSRASTTAAIASGTKAPMTANEIGAGRTG